MFLIVRKRRPWQPNDNLRKAGSCFQVPILVSKQCSTKPTMHHSVFSKHGYPVHLHRLESSLSHLYKWKMHMLRL